MKPELRKALQRERDFRPQFYQDMSDGERERHQARDNGLIPKGRVVRCKWRLQDYSASLDPSVFDLEAPTVRDYKVGEKISSNERFSFRVANWRYMDAGERDEEGNEAQIRIVVLTDRTDTLEPIDQALLDEMEFFDEGMAALIEDGMR